MAIAVPDDLFRRSPKRLGEILIEMDVATPAQITEALACQFGYPVIDLNAIKINPGITNLMKREVCREHSIFPISTNGKSLTIAISDPLDVSLMDNLKFTLEIDIIPVLAPGPDILDAIDRYYGRRLD